MYAVLRPFGLSARRWSRAVATRIGAFGNAATRLQRRLPVAAQLGLAAASGPSPDAVAELRPRARSRPARIEACRGHAGPVI
jgi:hypothetical protein